MEVRARRIYDTGRSSNAAVALAETVSAAATYWYPRAPIYALAGNISAD